MSNQTRILGPSRPVTSSTRVVWGLAAGACAVVLGVALSLKPNPDGHGTHRALGMPPCSFMITSGLPCPTCGMTTAFANTVRGRIGTAFLAQPAGLLMCLAVVMTLAYGVYVATSGRAVTVNWDRIGIRFMLGIGIILALSWGFKIGYGLVTKEVPVE